MSGYRRCVRELNLGLGPRAKRGGCSGQNAEQNNR
jgi:hypothetical protein